MEGTSEVRAAREIVALMGHKSLFEYLPEMEVSVPETDRKNSLDKIAYFYRSEEITLSDLYIGYVISLYRYTIPKVIADTIQVLGDLWPKKNVPRYINREALLSRVKKMCSMGMLRRYVYQHSENNIVLYATTAEFSKIIYQALKLSTDGRQEKDIMPPIEIVEKAAASLICCELIKSPFLESFDFMPDFRDGEGRLMFNSRLNHAIDGKKFATIVEPLFTRVDTKRFTEREWNQYLLRKIRALKSYMEQIEEQGEYRVQLIVVCEDTEDFRKVGTLICNTFSEMLIGKTYFTAEGSLKSAAYDIKNSLVHITSIRESGEGRPKVPESVSSQFPYSFF